jgi:hypothetical protein
MSRRSLRSRRPFEGNKNQALNVEAVPSVKTIEAAYVSPRMTSSEPAMFTKKEQKLG